jgi:hypothetical protein
MLKSRFKKFIDAIKTGSGKFLFCLESPSTIETKIPPIPEYYQTASLQDFPKFVSLEDVRSKSDAVIIETTKQTVIPTTERMRRATDGKDGNLYLATTSNLSNFKIIVLKTDGWVENVKFEATIRFKVIVKTKNNNYNNET